VRGNLDGRETLYTLHRIGGLIGVHAIIPLKDTGVAVPALSSSVGTKYPSVISKSRAPRGIVSGSAAHRSRQFAMATHSALRNCVKR